MAKETKAPSGFSISRSKEKLVLKWKQKETYNSQQLQYKLNTGSKKDAWKSISVGAGTTTKAITIDRDKYHPNKNVTLASISFRVRGKASNKDWSDWTKKVYDILTPNKPSVSVSQDSTLPNKTTFSWSIQKSDTDKRIYTKLEYRSLLVNGNAKPNWKKATPILSAQDKTSGSVTYTEDTSVIATGSHSRYFRARGVGPQGASGWVEKKFVHALPYQAANVEASVKETEEGGLNAVVTWTTKIDKAHPVAKTTVQYTMIVPDAGLECPSGASWVDANISKDIVDKGTNIATSKAVFSIDDVLAKDQCLFVRVNTQHAEEENINYGEPVLAEGGVGQLKDPSNPAVSNIDTSTHRVTITAVNNSDVEDSILAIIYRSKSEPDADFIIDTLPYNGSYTKTIQCPDWGDDVIGFGIYAVVGEVEEKTRADGVGSYAIDEKMRSANTIWAGGSVPQSPTGITANQTEIPGTIRVTWDWNWEEADSAVLSWADHADAWESTDEPEEFTINKVHASQWNISGLETGKTWYVRVRLVKGTEDDLTYGPWSELVSVDLSSAPNIPTLVLSEDVITADGTVTASWAYSSTDATAQAYAKICEVEITDEGLEYGDIIAHAQTAQHVDISAEVSGWQAGETHNLALMVMSASGRESNWSDPVSVTIAEPLTCEITETSLQVVSQEVNPRTFSGDIVTFDTEFAEDVPKAEISLEPIQDLHGYDKPWAGGGGKNLLPNTATTSTISGVTFTVNIDGSVVVNGTAQGVTQFDVGEMDFKANTAYTLTGCPTGGSAGSTYVLYARGTYDFVQKIDSGNGVTFTHTSDFTTKVTIILYAGATVNNIVFKPMVRLASVSDATYEPYSNICPIDGYEDVGVSVRGKNIFNYEEWRETLSRASSPCVRGNAVFEDNGITITATGNDAYTHFSLASYGYAVPVIEGKRIQLSWEANNNTGSIFIFPNGNTEGMVSANNTVAKSLTYTVGSGVTFITFRFGVTNTGVTIPYKNIMIQYLDEYSSTDYEPYAGIDYTTDLVTNIWDEEWEVGRYSTSTGLPTTDAGIRSKNYIQVIPMI